MMGWYVHFTKTNEDRRWVMISREWLIFNVYSIYLGWVTMAFISGGSFGCYFFLFFLFFLWIFLIWVSDEI